MTVESLSPQLTLPGFPRAAEQPARRILWRVEMRRALAVLADQRAGDQQGNVEALARLAGQLNDVRHRLTALERSVGIADLRRSSHHARGW